MGDPIFARVVARRAESEPLLSLPWDLAQQMRADQSCKRVCFCQHGWTDEYSRAAGTDEPIGARCYVSFAVSGAKPYDCRNLRTVFDGVSKSWCAFTEGHEVLSDAVASVCHVVVGVLLDSVPAGLALERQLLGSLIGLSYEPRHFRVEVCVPGTAEQFYDSKEDFVFGSCGTVFRSTAWCRQ